MSESSQDSAGTKPSELGNKERIPKSRKYEKGEELDPCFKASIKVVFHRWFIVVSPDIGLKSPPSLAPPGQTITLGALMRTDREDLG